MKAIRFLLPIAAGFVLLASCGGSKPETASAPTAAPGAGTAGMTRTDAAVRFYVDQVGTTTNPTPDKEISVPAAGKLSVGGWAADIGGDSVSGVEVTVDQKVYPATYGMERPDVASALKNPSYKNSGFQCDVPASELSNGTHSVAVRLFNKARNSYFETPAFHVRVQ